MATWAIPGNIKAEGKRASSQAPQGGRDKSRRLTKEDADMQGLLGQDEADRTGEFLMKLALQTTRRTAALEGVALSTVILPRENPLIKVVEEEGERYHKWASTAQATGPPHLWIGAALIKAIAQATYEPAQQMAHDIIKHLHNKLESMQLEEVSRVIRFCRHKQCYEKPGAPKLDRITFSLHGMFIPKFTLNSTLIEVMTYDQALWDLMKVPKNATPCLGPPPMNDIERRIRRSLEALIIK